MKNVIFVWFGGRELTDTSYPLMDSRMTTLYPLGLNKFFDLEIIVTLSMMTEGKIIETVICNNKDDVTSYIMTLKCTECYQSVLQVQG